MHLRTGMIQRGNAKENIVFGLAVVLLLRQAGAYQRRMAVQDGLGETCGARGEINSRIIIFQELNSGSGGRTVGDKAFQIIGEIGRIISHKKEVVDVDQLLHDRPYTAYKFGTEHQYRRGD